MGMNRRTFMVRTYGVSIRNGRAMSDDYPRFRKDLLPVLDQVYRERA